MSSHVKEDVMRILSDELLATSEEKHKELQKKVLKLQEAIDERESQLAKMQIEEFDLRRKCEKLLHDGMRCSRLETENMELQRALKDQRSRLLGIRSNKKLLKKKTRELALVESKCLKLEAALKQSKIQISKLEKAQQNAKKLEAEALQEELTSLEQLAAEEDEKAGMAATVRGILPRFSVRLITISISVSIFTSFYIFRYMY